MVSGQWSVVSSQWSVVSSVVSCTQNVGAVSRTQYVGLSTLLAVSSSYTLLSVAVLTVVAYHYYSLLTTAPPTAEMARLTMALLYSLLLYFLRLYLLLLYLLLLY